jgi:hypothetical protein
MFDTPTQTSPNATATGCGPEVPVGPTLTVATILFVAGSMREIVPPRCSVTQTAVFVAARPAGFGPALIVALTLLVAGSILRTTFSSKLATQTASAPAAMLGQQSDGIGTVAVTLFVAGSMRWTPVGVGYQMARSFAGSENLGALPELGVPQPSLSM